METQARNALAIFNRFAGGELLNCHNHWSSAGLTRPKRSQSPDQAPPHANPYHL